MGDNDYVTKDELKAARKESAEWTVRLLIDEIDATLVNHGKQLAAGARAIDGFSAARLQGKDG